MKLTNVSTRTILTHAITKNIPQHQQFVESLAKLLEPIPIPSSVVTFAVIRSLVLMGLQNCSRFISGLPFMSMASRILHKGIRWFSWPMIFTLISSMEWPASLVCSDTADLRSQACTDFRRVHLGHLALVPSFVAVSPMYSASHFLHLILHMTPNFSSATISSFGFTSR